MPLMESIMKIRSQILVEGRSTRSVERETGISRNTTGKYLDQPPGDQRTQTTACSGLKHTNLS